MLLEIANPRARISRTETRGKLFSCLGELCWYLAGRKDLAFIKYYIPKYREFAEDGEVFGGYGPRLFNWRCMNQFEKVAEILSSKPDSRQAVIQLFDGQDIQAEHKDVPCTSTLQFMLRQGKLHMITNMRSNDAYYGLPHDVFCFTMLQEMMACKLEVDVGTYKHAVGSLHLYKENQENANEFIQEGWQSTTSMPPMPIGEPNPKIELLLEAERRIRTKMNFDPDIFDTIEPYWADLVRLLLAFRSSKDKNRKKLMQVRTSMASDMYNLYLDAMLERVG